MVVLVKSIILTQYHYNRFGSHNLPVSRRQLALAIGNENRNSPKVSYNDGASDVFDSRHTAVA